MNRSLGGVEELFGNRSGNRATRRSSGSNSAESADKPHISFENATVNAYEAADLIFDEEDVQLDGEMKEIQTGKKLERPKKVLNRNRQTTFHHFLLFHAIPLGTAIALLIINIKTRFYGTDGSLISAFQFAAKAHEILMQLSIGMVMVAYLQYLLTHRKAIPFGAIFSAYQVTAMSYLWSREYRGALTTPAFRGLMKFVFVLFVPFSILLTAAVGPSSAIAMLPRQVNFTVSGIHLALNITSEILYPESFNEPGPPLSLNASEANFRGVELSPASGWEFLQDLPAVGTDEDTQAGLQQNERKAGGGNLQFFWDMPKVYSVSLVTYHPAWISSAALPVARTLYVQYGPNSTFATIQQVPIAESLANQGDFFYGDSFEAAVTSIEMPQPYVSVYCQLNSIMNENDTRPIQFPTTYVADCADHVLCGEAQMSINFANITNYTAVSRRQIWDEAIRRPQGQIIWVDDIQGSDSALGPMLGAIVVQSELCGPNDTFLMTSACVVGARWTNTTSYFQLSSDGIAVYSGVVRSDVSPASLSILPQWARPSVKLSKEWAQSLNPLTNVQNRTVADNLIRLLPVTDEICPLNGSYPLGLSALDNKLVATTRPFMHERLIASLVANGMSHAAGEVEQWQQLDSGSQWFYDSPLNQTQYSQAEPPGIKLKFQIFLPGYGWNLDGFAVKIAVAVLILYCLYTSIYVLYTFFTGHSSTTWSSISDLVALSLNSMPNRALKNTSAGIEQINTFRNLVSVREVESNERLELVFQPEEEPNLPYKRVVAGRAY